MPLVLVENGPKGTRISAPSPEAAALGLWSDMKLADARTMVPALRVEQHDRAADRQALDRLGRWLMRYSPSVARQGDNGFVLDISGCAHLFGGEAGMALDIVERLRQFGFSASIAIADTLAAAFALVMYGREHMAILRRNHAPDALDDLPVEALRLDQDTLVLLRRLGLKHVGDVRRIPRAALERRFREQGKKRDKAHPHVAAQSVQMQLDHLTGARAEPQQWFGESQVFRAVLQCPDFALEAEAVGIALDRLLADLCQQLSKAGLGGRHFVLHAYRADGGVTKADVRLSQPLHDPPVIRRLFRDRLEAIDCGFGVDLFVLAAGGVERVHIGQSDMMSGCAPSQSRTSLIAFGDTMANRVGRNIAVRFSPRASHVPERAQRAMPLAFEPDWTAHRAGKPAQSPRPLRLLERPEVAQVTADLPDGPPAQFVWRKVVRRVIRARGPERILPEWWHDSLKAKPSAIQRDYYDVEDTEGRRYWLFRSVRTVPVDIAVDEKPATDDDHEDAETAPPTICLSEWFVHGFF